MNLVTWQCPFCYYKAPAPGFQGICPKCNNDTSDVIRAIRRADPEGLSDKDRAAFNNLGKVFKGVA